MSAANPETWKTDVGHVPEKDRKRFLSKIEPDPNGGCWLWSGSVSRNGYGTFFFNDYRWSAHRFSYAMNKGPIPFGLHIMHHCDVRTCVNPAHLSAVPREVNVRDMFAKGRRPNHSGAKSPGAKLSEFHAGFICGMAKAGMKIPEIAEYSGMAVTTVRNIAAGKTWRDH